MGAFEFTVALRFLREGRFQSLLIVFGVAAGVAVVAFISALVFGLQNNTLTKTLGAQAHVVLTPLDERVTPDADVAAMLAAAALEVGLGQAPAFSIEIIEEQNWVQLTQSQFDPIRVSERLWIVPSWHAIPDPAAVNLILDPGMAFGTGSHPTTRLCLEWLERKVSAECSLLDYGCGSGILAIAAARLGAGRVAGVDIDPQAVEAAYANAERNGVISALFADSAQPVAGEYDLVVANILSNPLRVLAPAICAHVRSGGQLALSGILREQAEEIIGIYAAWLPLTVADTREDWVCLSGTKP